MFVFSSGVHAIMSDVHTMKTLIEMGRFNSKNGQSSDYDSKHRSLVEVWAEIEKFPKMGLSGIKEKLRKWSEGMYFLISKELKHISETSHTREEIINNLRCMLNAYASMCG